MFKKNTIEFSAENVTSNTNTINILLLIELLLLLIELFELALFFFSFKMRSIEIKIKIQEHISPEVYFNQYLILHQVLFNTWLDTSSKNGKKNSTFILRILNTERLIT